MSRQADSESLRTPLDASAINSDQFAAPGPIQKGHSPVDSSVQDGSGTAAVKRHYATLLAEHYSWMCGDLELRVAETVRFFEGIGIQRRDGRALDLGCGSGIQSLALSELGYAVTAVDFNARLLDELHARASDRRIQTIEADLTTIGQHRDLPCPFEVVVCMGDTLTHLPSMAAVERLIEYAASVLADDGRLVLGLRDLTGELTGIDRALPVRLEENRIMLTFLEYHPEFVQVHDMVLQRDGSEWRLSKSAYPKLRIPIDHLQGLLQSHDLVIDGVSNERGMYHLVAHQRLQ
jgi:SAM-dependent methyltransferase